MRNCNDCGAQPGTPHEDGCDIARCTLTGMQRIQHECADHCDTCTCTPCDPDIWTGEYPGSAEAREFGWFCYWLEPKLGQDYGEWMPCDADHPKAMPDLNRLMVEAVWNPATKRWDLPS